MNNSRVLLVNTRHYAGGGDSTYTFNLANLLTEKGHAVSHFAMRDDRNLPDPNADLFVSTIDFRELNRQKNIANGVKVLARSIYSAEARQKFAQLLDRVHPDLIHLQNIHAHITPSVILEAKERGIPVVWTLHDYKLICPNSHFLIDTNHQICEACRGGQFIQAVRRRCKKGSFLASGMASLEAYVHLWMNIRSRVDAFLCPSTFLRQKLIENGFPSEKVHHLPLFLPATQFVPSHQHQGYLLFLGKLEPFKGIFLLIEAARRVPEVKIILAGRVEERLQDRLPWLLPPNVVYAGLKSGKDLDALRRNAIGLVLPSLCYENQPFSILEMFACEKPVIASDLGGMKELVGNQERGLLVRPGHADDLAGAIRRLSTNTGLCEMLGQSAFRYARNYHSAASHYQRLTEIYTSVSCQDFFSVR